MTTLHGLSGRSVSLNAFCAALGGIAHELGLGYIA